MPLISIFSGIFSNTEPVVSSLIDRTGYQMVTDDMIITHAAGISEFDKKKLRHVFTSDSSGFNPFTLEKERAIAYLKLAVADMLKSDDTIFKGYTGLLIPQSINHVLRVCLIANKDLRLALAKKDSHLSSSDACQIMAVQDQNRAIWTNHLFSVTDPWYPDLYDIIVPMDKTFPQGAAELIADHLSHEAIRKNDQTLKALEDFQMEVTIETVLLDAGHHVDVSVCEKSVQLTITQPVLMLNRVEEELHTIVNQITDVQSINIHIAAPKNDADLIFPPNDHEAAPKVLLVDDEREFVQTLSNRLKIRNMGSTIAYDGESALEIVSKDEPEVLILDLKMPGIDGIEVLRQVKQSQPEIEVIVLTGHGSEQDKKTCLELGAFAFLQKPVDIDVLSQTLKAAHKRAETSSQKQTP
jgi:two-component system response regulator CpxR